MLQRFRHSTPLISILAAFLLALLAGCTTTTTATRPSARPAAAATSTTAAPSPVREEETARAHALVPIADTGNVDRVSEREIRNLYKEVMGLLTSAREALVSGDAETAGALYDQALHRLDNSGLQPEDDPHIEGLWTTVLIEMRDLEIEALAHGMDASGQPQGPTPLQALSEMEVDIQDLAVDEPEVQKTPDPVEEFKPALEYEFPIVTNRRVQTVRDYFTGPRRKIINAGLQRSGQYLPMIQRILEEEGLPHDLAWLPLIESNFKTSALSRAGAKGLWQFIPGTGRKYGLRIDWYVDERSDPEKATRAAAQYLKDLHGMFGDWHLALAAYNCGEGRVGRALRRTGEKDFWGLAQRRAIPSETRGYVPAFLAGLSIGKEPAKYGFQLEETDPLAYDVVQVAGPTDLRVLAKCAGTDLETLRALNPELRRNVTGGNQYALRVPPGLGTRTTEQFALVPPDQRLLYEWHKVRQGETLSIIARRYGSSIQAIALENGIRNPHRISVGKSLKIPRSGAPISTASRARAASRSSSHTAVHVVRRGQTLTSIARRYGTSANNIALLNGLRSKNRIYPGQRLKVSGSAPKPSAQYVNYRVRRGDTLYEIARKNGTSVSALRRWNGIRGSRIHPGDNLRIRVN